MTRVQGYILPAFLALFLAPPGFSQTVPDNGSGTANLPPAPYAYSGTTQIINGLPPASTINSVNMWYGYTGASDVPGGTMGGNVQNYTATMSFVMTGTGALASYSRSLTLPVTVITESATRGAPYSTPQSFGTQLFQYLGQLPPGDPDFDLLRITAGTNFGLPSPGNTVLTQSGVNWAVTSFFSVQYRIDFIGHPGGPLNGLSGSTTATSDFTLGTATPVELVSFEAD